MKTGPFRAASAGALLLGCLAVPCAARPFRFDELAKTARVGGFSVSPDGLSVAYAVGTPDPAANKTPSALWLAPASGGAARRLTSGGKSDSEPAFSPDGRSIAFLSDRDGGSQVWMIELAGGEPRKVTSFPTGVNSFRWSPDGRSLVFVSDVFPDCADAACLDDRVRARERSPIRARVAERLLFRHWDSWQNGLRSHVWRVPVAGGAAVDLTPGNRDAPRFAVEGPEDYEVSPDGKDLVFTSNPDRVEATSTNADLWIVPFASPGEPADLTASNPAFDGSPHFSPDGKWIAWRAQKRPGLEADRFTLMVADRTGGGRRELTPAFDDWVDEFAWGPDSRSIYFASHVQARSAIYRVGLDGGAPEPVWKGGGAAGLEVSRSGRRLYFLASSLTRAPEIFALPLDGGAAAAVTHVNDAFWKEGGFGLNASERRVTAADGRALHGWLVLPPGFDPSRKYPAVLLVHGGPQGVWADAWSTRWNPEVFAAYGYVVYAANPRGSTSFGQKFVDEVSGDWGGKAYDDLMRQTDDLASLPYVDRTKIGAAGASYGGYMVNWMAGHTDRFAAFVSHDGIFQNAAMALETEELWFPRAELGGWPWNSELYEKWNPARFVDHFRTPTLVVTSEKDFRVPFGQGLQLFTALQLKDVPSKLLTFPDEGHWVLKPGNSRLWHATVMDWLHRYLGGAEADPRALDTAFAVAR